MYLVCSPENKTYMRRGTNSSKKGLNALWSITLKLVMCWIASTTFTTMLVRVCGPSIERHDVVGKAAETQGEGVDSRLTSHFGSLSLLPRALPPISVFLLLFCCSLFPSALCASLDVPLKWLWMSGKGYRGSSGCTKVSLLRYGCTQGS